MNATETQLKNLDRKVFTDNIQHSKLSGRFMSSPTAIDRLGEALDKWDSAGPVKNWNSKTILVIDSLTFLGRAMARQFQQLNKISLDRPIETRQFGMIQGMIIGLMDQLHSDTRTGPHLIVITHLDYRDYEAGTFSSVGMMEQGDKPGQTAPDKIQAKGVPTVFGAKLGPQIGQYFDFMLRTKIDTLGGLKPRRVIQTNPDAFIDLKCPLLSIANKGDLPLSDGLATIFNEWTKRNPET